MSLSWLVRSKAPCCTGCAGQQPFGGGLSTADTLQGQVSLVGLPSSTGPGLQGMSIAAQAVMSHYTGSLLHCAVCIANMLLTAGALQGRVNLGGLPTSMNPGLGGMGMAASPRLPGGNLLHMRDHGVEPQASKNLMDILGKTQGAATRGFNLPAQGEPSLFACLS